MPSKGEKSSRSKSGKKSSKDKSRRKSEKKLAKEPKHDDDRAEEAVKEEEEAASTSASAGSASENEEAPQEKSAEADEKPVEEAVAAESGSDGEAEEKPVEEAAAAESGSDGEAASEEEKAGNKAEASSTDGDSTDDDEASAGESGDDEGEKADSGDEDDEELDEEAARAAEAAATAALAHLSSDEEEDEEEAEVEEADTRVRKKDATTILRDRLKKQGSQKSGLSKQVSMRAWDDWEEDPDNALAWFAERECLVLLLEARMLLKEMIMKKLKAERTAKGNLSIGEIRDLLNSQKEDAENDWIAEIQDLKRNLVSEVRGNHVLESEQAKLDKRISLLIKNRGDISKDIGKGKSSKRKTTAGESALLAQAGKLEGYEQLFYLLQTEPKYIARLVFVMTAKEMKSFLDTVILTLFGASFSPREEFLILRLFQQAIEGEMETCKKINDFIAADSVVPTMVVSYIRRQQGVEFLKKLIGPVVKDVLSRETVLELKPVEVYKTMITLEETKSGKKSTRDRGLDEKAVLKIKEVKTMLKERTDELLKICDNVVDRVLRDLKKVPYGVRWICKTIRALAEEQFPDLPENEYNKVVGYFAYFRFINLAIVSPATLELIDEDLDLKQAKNLQVIGKVLQALFNMGPFTSKSDKSLFVCNDWINSRTDDIVGYYNELIEVEEPEEYLRVDRYMELTQETKPVIMITTDEIILTHHHLEENLQTIAKDKNDPMRIILKELGAAPSMDDHDNREIQLTLTNKFKQDLEEDVSASAALYAETKELVIALLRTVPLSEATASGDELTLIDILEFGRKWGKEGGNNSIVSDVKKINKNLSMLEEEKFVNRGDQYATFLRDVALEVANRAEIREQQRKEIKRLTQTLRNLRKHHRYLEERIDHYEAYLKECRQRHFQGAQKKGKKGKKDQVFMFKYSDLKKKQIINDSSVPKISQGICKFELKADKDEFGSFDVTCYIGGKKVGDTLVLELDELLERNANNIASIDFEDVSLDVNLTIALLNKLFAGKK